MRDELVGVWLNESEIHGMRSETRISIGTDGSFVTRMRYQMPDGCQTIEHRGRILASETDMDITLDAGFTQDEAAEKEGLPMKPFTNEEFQETKHLLANSIPYRFTDRGELATEPQGPDGKMQIVYRKL
ncbi:MAG: hypothetical protein Aurels2KO_21790 [Aureliella sp.]